MVMRGIIATRVPDLPLCLYLEDQVVMLLIYLRIPNSQVNVFFNDVTRHTCGRTLVLYLFATHVVGHPFRFLFNDAALVLCGG